MAKHNPMKDFNESLKKLISDMPSVKTRGEVKMGKVKKVKKDKK